MSDVLFFENQAKRILLQRPGVLTLWNAKKATPTLHQLQGFHLTRVCHLTPHQLDILDVTEVTDLLLAKNRPDNFNWLAAINLDDGTSTALFGRSVDALISSKSRLNAYS